MSPMVGAVVGVAEAVVVRAEMVRAR